MKKEIQTSGSDFKLRRMLIIFGSTITLIMSLIVYNKSPKYWSTIANKLIIELKINLLGMKETVIDILRARYNKTDLPIKTGCVAIVTGGSRGIGLNVVKMLLQCDIEVIIACRKIEAGEKAVQDIRKSGITKGKAIVYQLDNSSLESVRTFSENVKQNYTKIHLLINNAGIMFPPYEETVDGFEQQWAVNYLSHFMLTALMIPLLKNAGTSESSARVINVSSCAHLIGTINFDDINYSKNQPFMSNAAYAQSKLAQAMFTQIVENVCKKNHLPIHAFTIHPGIVNTDLFINSIMYKFTWFMNLFFKTPQQGATTIVYAAVDKSLENRGGIYLSNCLECPVNPLVKDEPTLQRLLQLSLKQVKLNSFLQYL